MRAPRRHVALAALVVASWAALAANGCSATPSRAHGAGGGASAGSGSGFGGGAGGGSTSSHSATASSSGIVFTSDAGDASDAMSQPDVTNPCGSKCGPTELCDPAHVGLDDNCNGGVDEGCACAPGSVHWCFKGDPSYHNAPGCFDGTMSCSELGLWGPCTGGVHAISPDNCFQNNTSACHAITSRPDATVDLATGTGQYSVNAVPGTETYTVTCPTGVSQCPGVVTPHSFTAVQSGEYTVRYTKKVAGDVNIHDCTFPLIVGAPGLRVELTWEHTTADMGVDLDLHLHQPVNVQPWDVSLTGSPQDCSFASCTVDSLVPEWFPTANVAPMPCNWDIQPNPNDNTCYNDPRGQGMKWQALQMGCHNPRLDSDNIQCDFSITDTTDPNFCAPENINVDYPPSKEWFRIGVHYYNNYLLAYDVHPEVKVYCNGALSADLGPHSFYMPESPVTFEPGDGAGPGDGNRFWIAADVAFTGDACGNVSCVVQPIYSDPAHKTPFLTIDNAATTKFAPAWPPPPQ